jgi:hypothetical protein
MGYHLPFDFSLSPVLVKHNAALGFAFLDVEIAFQIVAIGFLG